MIRQQMNKRARLIRSVAVNERDLQVFELANQPWFTCQLIEPTDTQPAEEESPRAMPAYRLRWLANLGAPLIAPAPGYRIELEATEYEVLNKPRPLKAATRLEGWEARMLPVSTLYPLTGDLLAQDGSIIASGARAAIVRASEERRTEGTYETLDADLPADLAGLAKQNTRLLVNGENFHFLETVIDTVGPHVRASVRKAVKTSG